MGFNSGFKALSLTDVSCVCVNVIGLAWLTMGCDHLGNAT